MCSREDKGQGTGGGGAGCVCVYGGGGVVSVPWAAEAVQFGKCCIMHVVMAESAPCLCMLVPWHGERVADG